MAWTSIDNSLVSVGALPFATTIQALRDNPVAIANGDAGAPRVQAAAIADNSITPAKVPVSTVVDRIVNIGATAVGAQCLMTSGRTAGSVVTYTVGSTRPGSELTFSSAAGVGSGTGAGTWRCKGYMQDGTGVTPQERTTDWERIA